ncbi:major facilitator superfamily domain-containing protein [Aspergillus filifer]
MALRDTISQGPDRDIRKDHAETVEVVQEAANANRPNPRKEAPAYVAALSPEEREQAEKALIRKIDARLLPIIIIMYILNYLDRNNIVSVGPVARLLLAGLEDDLELDGVQYQICVSILFVRYLLMQNSPPLMLNNIKKPAIYLPCSMILWDIISTCTAAAQNYAGLVVPECLYFLSAWYTKKELGFPGITGNMDGKLGLRAWRWLFIIEGAVTILVAICAIFILPNFPRTTGWLSEEEKQLAAWRLEEDIGEDDWMLLILCIVSSASVTNFFPTVVGTLNYGDIETLLLTAPPYVLAVITAFLNAWHSNRTEERYFHSIQASKRAAAVAGINCVSNASSIYASYMYADSDKPRFVVAMSVNCATAFVAILAATVLRIILVSSNKRLDIREEIRCGVLGQVAGRGFRFLV